MPSCELHRNQSHFTQLALLPKHTSRVDVSGCRILRESARRVSVTWITIVVASACSRSPSGREVASRACGDFLAVVASPPSRKPTPAFSHEANGVYYFNMEGGSVIVEAPDKVVQYVNLAKHFGIEPRATTAPHNREYWARAAADKLRVVGWEHGSLMATTEIPGDLPIPGGEKWEPFLFAVGGVDRIDPAHPGVSVVIDTQSGEVIEMHRPVYPRRGPNVAMLLSIISALLVATGIAGLWLRLRLRQPT